MIRIRDHTTNPRSGRPEADVTWPLEAFKTLLAWAMAAMFVGVPVAYFREGFRSWQILIFIGGGVLCGTVAYLHGRALRRKREALRRALDAYEKMLARPMDWPRASGDEDAAAGHPA